MDPVLLFALRNALPAYGNFPSHKRKAYFSVKTPLRKVRWRYFPTKYLPPYMRSDAFLQSLSFASYENNASWESASSRFARETLHFKSIFYSI